MPTQIKAAPFQKNIGRSFNGKTVQQYTVNLGSDLTNELGPNGAVQRVLLTLAQRVTPVLISDLNTGNAAFDYYVEGEFPSDDYNGDGSDETFATHLQSTVQALGTIGVRGAEITAVTGETTSAGISVATATVTAGEVFYADHTPGV